MKNKLYTAIGLMSGTSMDGVDISIIRSDGYDQFINILDEYHEYDNDLHQRLVNLRNLILNHKDIEKYSQELSRLERDITFFHSKIVNKILLNYEGDIDLVGFHGQTIFHNPIKKISRQIGDGYLLSQIIKKNVVFNFRQEDLKNDGQGAPLTPVFHNLLARNINKKHKIEFPIFIMNIGGISNITAISNNGNILENNFKAFDLGPGNCLIDDWIRKNSNERFDENGSIAKSGKINKFILNQAIENFKINSYEQSLDVKDFDITFARGLSLEDGCATITSFTAYLIAKGIKYSNGKNKNNFIRYLVCGGGRKNSFLLDCIKGYLLNESNIILEPIDKYGFDGDYIESQAFGYIAIRSFINLPISFPNTTGCNTPTKGGELIKNF